MSTGGPSRSARPSSRRGLLPLLAVCGVALVALCIGVVLAARVMNSSFEQVETAATFQKAQQVYRAFEADLHQLAISNRDYAEWDVAQDFVRTANPDFIAANLTADTMGSMFVDLVWISDGKGETKYSGLMDRKSGKVQSPAPASLLAAFASQLRQQQTLKTLPPVERMVATPQGLAAFSVHEVTATDHSGPTAVMMLFARFIQEAEIERVRTTSHMAVSLIPLGAASNPASGLLPAPVLAWTRTTGRQAPTFVYSPNNQLTMGYALVRTIGGAPAAVFETRGPRDILALGRRTTRYMLGSLFGLFVAFGVAVASLVIRLQHSFALREAAQRRYETLGSQLREAIAVIDGTSHQIVEANDTVLRALTCERADLSAFHIRQLLPEITPTVLAEAGRAGAAGKVFPSRLQQRDGSWLDAEVSITSFEEDGRLLMTLVVHDISHRKEAIAQGHANRRKLLQLAQHDSLTGLPNRLYLRARLPQVLEKIANGERLLALIYVDIDNFKNINDSRGHACGDQLLQIVARRLRAAVSMQDMVARMGGDEFVIVASLMPDRASVDTLASRLQTAVSAPIVINDESLSVTASLGIAVYPDDGLQIDSLLKNADIALYQAKEAGRQCHRFFAADMDLRVSEHVALEQALRHATGSDQIFLEYQPVIDLTNGRVASLEALLRWRHPDRGMIPPSRFIPVAEQSGIIVELGLQALRDVILQQRAWLDAGVPIVPIAVNVSPVQLERTDFAAQVARLSKEHGVDPRWLRFEITESAVMKEPDRLIATLQTLRDLGSFILIDDFGTGYSSLSYLNRLPVDVLKIDRAFVRDLGQGLEHNPIISAVIDIARKLNLFTIAEGVETAEQVQLLREQGCDYAQGYYYSKPVAVGQCRTMLEHLNLEKPLTETLMVRVEESMLKERNSASG